MVVKGDQQRIRALIKDTLTLLCKNGLSFDTQFSMEALIVFTLDDEEVFHVSINETVKNQLAKAQSIAENESNDSFVEDSSPHFPSDRDSSQQKTGSWDTNKRPNRKRTLSAVKQELSEQGAGDENGGQWPADDSWNQKSPPDPDISPATYDESSFQSQGSTEPPTAKRRTEHSSSTNDIIIIKEEMDDSASEQNVSYNTQAPYGDIDLAQALGSDSLGAGPSQSSAPNMWADPSQHQNMPRTATITSEGGDMSQMQQTGFTMLAKDSTQATVQPDGRVVRACAQCNRTYASMSGLRTHIKLVHRGIYNYYCPRCGRGFSSTTGLKHHAAKCLPPPGQE